MGVNSSDVTTTDLTGRSPAASRMRLHRQRRRMGLRCIVIELRATEVDELVQQGFLTEDDEQRH